jgi:hypothetical protein
MAHYSAKPAGIVRIRGIDNVSFNIYSKNPFIVHRYPKIKPNLPSYSINIPLFGVVRNTYVFI